MQSTITTSNSSTRKTVSDRLRARAARSASAVETAYLRELTAKAPLTNRTAPAFCS